MVASSAEPRDARQPGDLPRVFLSVTGTDLAWGEWLYTILRGENYRVDFYKRTFAVGSSFIAGIDAALAECDVMIAVLTEQYCDPASWVSLEWQAALSISRKRPGFLLPILVETCDLPPLLAALSYVDVVGLDEELAMSRILAELRRGRPQEADGSARPMFPGVRRAASPPALERVPAVDEPATDTAVPSAASGSQSFPLKPTVLVESVTAVINRRANRYADLLEWSRSEGRLGEVGELELLPQFEEFAADLLESFEPPALRDRRDLLLAELYAKSLDDPSDERACVAALFAAEVEFRGPMKLTSTQTVRLADIMERLGNTLRGLRLPLHAALAYGQAADAYRSVGSTRSRDRCHLAALRSRHRARNPGLVKLLEALSDMLCGYGYLPFRLLSWILAQVAAATAVLTLVFAGSVTESLRVALLGPLSFAMVSFSSGVQILAVINFYGMIFLFTLFIIFVARRTSPS
jgi:hypothetical protein